MFTTPVHIPASDHKISLSSPVLAVGSCFAHVIGNRLKEHKFKAYVNPFGTIYNPAALFRLIHDAINNTMPSKETYLERNGIFFNYKFHSTLFANSKDELEAHITQTISSTHHYLSSAKYLIITLGTAFSYERLEDQLIVSNCHKMPAHTFNKRMLEVEEIVQRFDQLFSATQAFNPDIQFIFTVSPIRHLRDTLVQNSASKATLRVAADMIQRKHPEKVYYFPSYEVMMDELRDYRFYDADMLHPSKVAEVYIWQKFCDALLDQDTISFLKKWERLSKAVQHRPFYPASEMHQKFLKQTIQELQQLSNIVDVQKEIESLERQLL